MKKRFLITTLLIGLLVSCPEPVRNNPDDNENPVNPGQKTVIVFDNTQGICIAAAFSDYRRRDEDKIAEIPAGARSREVEWTPGTSVPFYFSYRINLKGISGFTLNYTPKEVGKDQTAVRIDANTKTAISIPKLEETLSSPDTLLTNDSFLLIQNNSSYSFQLHQGSSQINPDGSPGSAVVNPGERAQYTITPGSTSNYRLLVGANYVTLPGSLTSFAAGRVYNLVFDGGVSLVSEVEIKLANVAGFSPNNPVPQIPDVPSVPSVPGVPNVTASYGLLTVHWTAVEGAVSYEIWVGITDNLATAVKQGDDVQALSVVITGLTNGTTYYVWIRAKNSTGVSDYGPSASGVPIERRPGLYRGIEKIGDQNLSVALSYISSNAIHGDDFYIVLGEDESVSPMTLNYSGKTVGITLLGYDGEKTITLNSTGSMFTINAGVILTIDENITLIGLETNNTYLVSLSGELIINNGAKIINNNGGGISVSSIGTVIMYGGSISGNTASNYGGGIYTNGGTVIMHGGTISSNNSSSGISIFVSSSGTFTMYGGTISGDLTSTGISVSSGNFTMHGGTISGSYIYANGGTVIMNGGTISGNYDNGIYVSSGTVTMNGGTISGNRRGIYIYGNYGSSITVTMNGGTISGSYESGIYVSGNGSSGTTVTMNGGTISGNASNNGGGISVSSGNFTMHGGTISGNTASNNGGGIYVSGGTVTMHGGTISGNNSNIGGGIYASSTFKKLPSGNGQNSGTIYGFEETGVDADGVQLRNTANSNANAVYSSSRMRNTTAGQTDHIDSTTGRGLSANGNAPFGE